MRRRFTVDDEGLEEQAFSEKATHAFFAMNALGDVEIDGERAEGVNSRVPRVCLELKIRNSHRRKP